MRLAGCRTLSLILQLTFFGSLAGCHVEPQKALQTPKERFEQFLSKHEKEPREALKDWGVIQNLGFSCTTPIIAQFKDWLSSRGLSKPEIDQSFDLYRRGNHATFVMIHQNKNFRFFQRRNGIPYRTGYVDKVVGSFDEAYEAFFTKYGFRRPLSGSKIPVFLGQGASLAEDGHIHLGEGADITSTPAHELFHLIQQATWLPQGNGYTEGGAGWAEDIVSPTHDAANTYPRIRSADMFTHMWTGPNSYSFAYFYKYLQQWKAAFGGEDASAYDFGVDVIRRLYDKIGEVAGTGQHLTPAKWDEVLRSEISPDMTLFLMMKYFLIAAYTKDLGDPFENRLPPGATIEPYPLFNRWDFLEDEEPNTYGPDYPPLVLSQTGRTLSPGQSLSFTNVNTGFSRIGHAEYIKVALSPWDRGLPPTLSQTIYFRPTNSDSEGSDSEKISYAAIIQYRHENGNIYVKPILDLDAALNHRINIYDARYLSSGYTAEHLIIIPFTIYPGSDDGGKRFNFRISFEKE